VRLLLQLFIMCKISMLAGRIIIIIIILPIHLFMVGDVVCVDPLRTTRNAQHGRGATHCPLDYKRLLIL